MLYFAKAKGTILDIYEIASELDSQNASQTIKLKSTITLNDGDVIKLKAGMNAIHFREVNDDMVYHEVSDSKALLKSLVNTTLHRFSS